MGIDNRADVERYVIGGMLLSSHERQQTLARLITPDMFTGVRRLVATEMLKMSSDGVEIDTHLLSLRIKTSDADEHQQNISLFLADCLEFAISGAAAENHINELAKIAARSRIERSLKSAVQKLVDGDDTQEVVSKLQESITESIASSTAQVLASRSDQMLSTLRRVEEQHASKKSLQGITTGFGEIDRKLSGWCNGNLVILAARPSQGKTAMAVAGGMKTCAAGGRVGLVSLEMSAQEINMRRLSIASKVRLEKIREAIYLDSTDFKVLSHKAAELSEMNFFIDDSSPSTLSGVVSSITRLREHDKCNVIFVDFLQRIMPHGEKVENQNMWIAKITATMKDMARSMKIPIVLLSQLSRQSERRGGDFKPMLSDLRDSGAIEQDSDIVMFIHRPSVYWDRMTKRSRDMLRIGGKAIQDPSGIAEIIIAKNRSGPIGECLLTFRPEFTSFEPFAHQCDIEQHVSHETPDDDEERPF